MTGGMDWMAPILEQIHSLRCPSCRGQLDEGMVRGLATEEDRLLIQLACAGCGELTLAIVEHVTVDVPEEARPFTPDDVLEAHDILRRFEGTVEELFARAA